MNNVLSNVKELIVKYQNVIAVFFIAIFIAITIGPSVIRAIEMDKEVKTTTELGKVLDTKVISSKEGRSTKTVVITEKLTAVIGHMGIIPAKMTAQLIIMMNNNKYIQFKGDDSDEIYIIIE